MGLSKKLGKNSVLATLTYHDFFDYPLKKREINKLLIKKPLIKTKKKIIFKDGYYFLKGREKIISIRKKRQRISQEKLQIAKKTVNIFKIIPFIKTASITGALAMNNSKENDDIDFLIITQKNRLWLTRFLIITILQVLGKRRKPKDKEYKNKICLNMFLDETALKIPKQKQNLFTAHEIIQAKPILNKNKTWQRFLNRNTWVKNYLPNAAIFKKTKTIEKKKKSLVLDYIEKFVFYLQLKYMKSKLTKEQISLHFAYFHPKDRGRKIIKRYKDY